MKNNLSISKLLLVLTIPLFLFQSCSEDNTEVITEDNSKLLEILKQWGFEENEIEDKGEYYLVERDIMFFKNREYPSPIEQKVESKGVSKGKNSRQTYRQYLVAQENRQISVAFDVNVSQTFKNATISAMNEWNSICNVYFFTTNNYVNADIQVSYSLLGGAAASGGYPTFDQRPGEWLYIDNTVIGSYSALAQKWVIVHELGHNIGFDHSYNPQDIPPNNCSNISNIPGTPNCDFNSIMGFNTGGNTFAFSYYDIIAAKWLFPYPPMETSSYNGEQWPRNSALSACSSQNTTMTYYFQRNSIWQLTVNDVIYTDEYGTTHNGYNKWYKIGSRSYKINSVGIIQAIDNCGMIEI